MDRYREDPGTGTATLAWGVPPWNGGSPLTGYDVFEGTTPGGESSIPLIKTLLAPTAKGYTVKGLTTGTRYYFTVKALNAVGPGAPSDEASVVAVAG
jgi:titin